MTSRPSRREVLAASAAALLIDPADAATIKNALPWKSGSVNPPAEATPGPWHFFTAEEAARALSPKAGNANPVELGLQRKINGTMQAKSIKIPR